MKRFNRIPVSWQRMFFIPYLLALPLITLLLLGLAGSWSDSVRLAFLSLPGCWLCFQATKKPNLFWKLFSIIWWFIFIFHTSLLSVSWLLFNSDAEAYSIIESIANTTLNESLEFFQLHFGFFILIVGLILSALILYFFILFKYFNTREFHDQKVHRLGRYAIGLLFLLCTASYAIKPSMALHPLPFWYGYYGKIQDFKQRILQHDQIHKEWTLNAEQRLDFSGQLNKRQTHTIVLTDSITSFNFGLCGYPRNTTPELTQRSDQFKVFCRGYSPASSTIQSLRYLFNDGTRNAMDDHAPENIMAYAKAAGFKVYWISNQDDVYISSLFASFADEAVFINKKSGRSSTSLDENILPAYKIALDDPDPRKLIILHLIGSHPNYKLRYPEQFSKFNDSDKSVRFNAAPNFNIEVIDTDERIYGLEANVKYAISDMWNMGGTIAYTRGQFKNILGDWQELDATRVSPLKGTLFSEWQFADNINLRVQTLAIGGTDQAAKDYVNPLNDRSIRKPAEIKGFAIMDVITSAKVGPGRLGFGVYNVWNTDYKTVFSQAVAPTYGAISSLAAQGRSYGLTYTLKY
ncbi:sulfatase-like hydrolase/transferase [Acinetobacter guillouiae]|uniref:phosphoethanolamine transferase n=1 Tax=Acinetobacter guillouiae TaxID=106649 RepID=UPI003D0172C7